MKPQMSRRNANISIRLAVVLALIISAGLFMYAALGQPTGASITFNSTEYVPASPAGSLTTAGGSFTKLVLNGSFQTQRWKAYVGNVTGIITLQDAASYTIYNWDLAAISGEVYVSRKSNVTWTNISCANQSTIYNEQAFLNIPNGSSDSINRTFNQTIHKEFFVGVINITRSSCRSIATYVNDTKQIPTENAEFQEILLKDNTDNVPVYATILENKVQGYDLNSYDFQLIVPEDDTKPTPTTYYFYVEIS